MKAKSKSRLKRGSAIAVAAIALVGAWKGYGRSLTGMSLVSRLSATAKPAASKWGIDTRRRNATRCWAPG